MVIPPAQQDMPPPGGYKALSYKRIPGQQYFTTRFLYAYFGAMTAISFVGYYAGQVRFRHKQLDNADREVAIHPFMLAERDRAYLKYLKKCRSEEEKVMKDVPNWKVGHYYNMPIYKTIPDDYHLDPNVSDYFAHTSDEDYRYIWLYPSVNFHGVNLNI